MVSNYLCLFGLLWALLSPALAGAQVTFYVTAESDRAFVIEADDIDAGSAVELTVVYDSQSLANPKASLTQGTLTDMVDAAGTLVLSAVQGEDSTATFGLHLKFDKAEGRPGGIFSVRGTITGPDGAAASSRTLPGASSPEVLQSFSGACEPAPEDAEGPPEILSPGQNVLQRFRNFQGKRGVKAFAALFRRSPSDGMVQDPPVVLSDGKEPVRIHFASGEGADPPDVALSDAKLLSLAREGDQGWVLTALPNEGTWDA